MQFMAKAWKVLDLEGGGLQATNLILTRRLKKASWAYFLWLFFPLGAHCLYLQARGRASIYWVLTLLILGAAYFASTLMVAVVALPLIALALYDLRWIDDRRAELNKQIRLQVYMSRSGGPPAGFRGRFADDTDMDLAGYLAEKEKERGGHQPVSPQTPATTKRTPSFTEQEAMLRELAKKKKS